MKPDSLLSNRGFVVVATCFLLVVSLCVIAYVNEVRLGSLTNFGKCANSQTPLDDRSPKNESQSQSQNQTRGEELRIFIGILTLPDQYLRRHFLRLVYGTQSPTGARVDVRFVFCNLTKEDQKVLVPLEIMRHDDIIILNCPENMNKGKTYTYFSSLSGLLTDGGKNSTYPPYHYVMKADDDTYFRLQNLVDSLVPLPRDDLYYGYVIPCESMDPFIHYMSGMGYLVSWDIVEWIKESEIPKKHVEGPEDMVFGDWLRDGGRGKNRYNAKWAMYNFPEPPDQCTHELWPDTVAVHKLKTQEMWITTLSYFNFTMALKPSKFYHVP